MKARTWGIVAVAISIVTVVVLFAAYRIHANLDIAEAFSGLEPWAVPAALGLHVVAHLVWAGRMAAVSRGMDAGLGIGDAMRLVTAGVFGAAVTPGRVGGDGLRYTFLRRRGWEAGAIGRVLLADRILDVLFFLVVGFVALGALPGLFGIEGDAVRGLVYAGLAALGLLVAGLVALLLAPERFYGVLRPLVRGVERVAPKVGGRLHETGSKILREARRGLILLVQERQGWLLLAVVLTYITWFAEFAILWVLLRGLGHDVPLAAAFFVGALLNILTSLPLTPGGSGIAEVAALALFAPLAAGLTPAFVLLWRAITFYYDLVVGGIVAARGSKGLPARPRSTGR